MATDFKSIPSNFFFHSINFLEKTFSFLSSLCSDPLFSTIITLYTLTLLYLPTLFFRIVFSPVLISTGISLLILLRLGSIQRIEHKLNSITEPQDCQITSAEPDSESEFESGKDRDPDPKPFLADCFFEWNVRAPLEVIYEAYEGEEEEEEEGDNNNVSNGKQDKRVPGIDRYSSLSLYYPESDTDSSSDDDFPVMREWDSAEGMCLRWEEEDKDGLIEISLEGKRTMEFFHAEEDNMIEIDISPMRLPARVRYS